jgi:hypothetical protein
MALFDRKAGGMNGDTLAHDANRGPQRADPTALTFVDAAKLLSAAGGQRITAEMIQADVDIGVPTNGDGTINLVNYTAWLVKQAIRPFDCSTVRNGADVAPNSPTAEQPNSLRAGGTHD